MSSEEFSRMIADYELQNGIEVITEEELLDFIPESELYPNLYLPEGWEDDFFSWHISDYEWDLLQSGFNPFTGEVTLNPAYFIHEDVDEIMPYEVSGEFCWCPCNGTFEETIEMATIMDKLYLVMDTHGNIVGYDFFDVGDNINEYMRLKGYDGDCEFMKVDEPGVDEVEWESALADDLEYYVSLGTKIIDVDVADLNELEQFLKRDIHETAYRIKIHLEADAKRFLIVVTVDEQYIIYRVFHELDNASINNLKSLGWDTWPESALQIIDYYLETGLTKECYQ
ncbi:MAG: hypothetical protein IPN67_17200 [Bacteroidales bacterium]|nr:hypothetical protein [Bacteroidales bacterium]